MQGITIRPYIGVGDSVQFSSLPENYFHSKNEKIIDVSKHWIFDHNPFVVRDLKPKNTIELWNFGPKQYEWPMPREDIPMYQSNAEIWSSIFNVRPKLIRPRLYKFEDFPFHKREMILFHTHGKSHGALPDHVIDHVLKKYKPTKQLFHIGYPDDPDIGIPKIKTKNIWDLVKVISESKMLIGVDSGPAWIAACYPDIVLKKVRVRKVHGSKTMDEWIPLERENIHSHWDDRAFLVFNTHEHDVGFTMSYKKL
jgi:hypothetical protein